MARTTLTRQVVDGPFPGAVSAGDLDYTYAASDVANGNDFVPSGCDILLVENTDAGTQTITLTSAPGRDRRSADITTYSLAAGDFMWFLFSRLDGWRQTDGKIYINTSDAGVTLAVGELRL